MCRERLEKKNFLIDVVVFPQVACKCGCVKGSIKVVSVGVNQQFSGGRGTLPANVYQCSKCSHYIASEVPGNKFKVFWQPPNVRL